MVNIVVDSGCDFNDKLRAVKDIDISLVPLNIQLGDKNYEDDENLDVDSFIDDMVSYPGTPKTAAPSPEKYLEKIKKEGSTFVVTISSHLSGSYNSAMLAKELYLDEIGCKFIHVFDSLSASLGETLVALKIVECAKSKLTDNEIVESVEKFIKKMKTSFVLESYDTLVKNGRMNPYVAKIASMLNIKAICVGVEGKIKLSDKARGFNKAVNKLIDQMVSEDDLENRTLAIMHVRCLEKAQTIKDEVMKRVKFKEIFIAEARGLCATYASNKGIVIAY